MTNAKSRLTAIFVAASLVVPAVLATQSASADSSVTTAGFAVRSILPDPADYSKLHHVSRKTPTGVIPGDGVFASATFVATDSERLGIVGLDVLGLFYDDVIKIRDAVRSELGPDVQVIVTSSHSHSTIDTLGIYGPNQVTSGIDPEYQELVRSRAAEAVIAAAQSAVPVSVKFASRPAPDGINEYDVNDTPGSFDDNVRAIQFIGDAGVVGTLINWASHPELVNPKSSTDPDIPAGIRGSVISSDYVGALRSTVTAATGAPTVFVNGPVGAVTALAKLRNLFPEKSVAKARYVGNQVGQTALDALASPDVQTVANPGLDVASKVFDLRIDNPFILALKAAGVVDRQTYMAGQPVPFGRDVRTEMVRVKFGPAEFLTMPGELHPDVYTGVFLPHEERANPDVPGEQPIRDQMTSPMSFVVGLAMDELGYFVSATDYVAPSTVSPLYGNGIDRNGRDHYQETLSLGRDTARKIGQHASELLGTQPEPDYEAYRGGFLDEHGVPTYTSGSMQVRGIWVDTSDSGRYERNRDAELFTPLLTGIPAGFGYLDAYMRDMGTTPGPEARGVWVDGNGDGLYDPVSDPHLLFDSYHIGKGGPEL